jgi:hypothetical protein
MGTVIEGEFLIVSVSVLVPERDFLQEFLLRVGLWGWVVVAVAWRWDVGSGMSLS